MSAPGRSKWLSLSKRNSATGRVEVIASTTLAYASSIGFGLAGSSSRSLASNASTLGGSRKAAGESGISRAVMDRPIGASAGFGSSSGSARGCDLKTGA